MKKSLMTLLWVALITCGLAFIDSAHFALAQSVNTSPTFSISIVASINNFSSTCVFGIDPDSTTTYSSKYDSLASYPNGGGVYCYFNYYNSSTYQTLKLSKYIVPSNGSTTWHLEVESIDQEGILTLNWSSGTAFGSLILEDGIINKIVFANMNAVGNFSFSDGAGGVSDFDIVYQSATATTPTSTPTPSPTLGPSSTPTPSSAAQSPNPSLSPTLSPSIPEFPSWIILPLVMLSVLLAVAASKRKTRILTNCHF